MGLIHFKDSLSPVACGVTASSQTTALHVSNDWKVVTCDRCYAARPKPKQPNNEIPGSPIDARCAACGKLFSEHADRPDPSGFAPSVPCQMLKAYFVAANAAAAPVGHLIREINTHKVNGVNDLISVFATDKPGPGGANHEYSLVVNNGKMDGCGADLHFQNGAIRDAGVNGITHEALLAVLIDRLEAFQRGPFLCEENALALIKLREALHWLNLRTQARQNRGVEGTHSK